MIDHPFLLMALWASLLASFASGVIGSFVVVKRISFLAGSISHSVLGGMGFCLWMQRHYGIEWLDPMIGAFVASLVSAVLVGWIHLRFRQREDAVIAAIWATGMSIGVIFISLTPGSNVDLINFLFGNILWVTGRDLLLLGGMNLLILAILAAYYRPLLALCHDEEQALLQGVAVQRLYMVLLSLVALSIVALIQVIGTILVMALLTIPAMLANLYARRLVVMMGFAVGFSMLFSIVGLESSYFLNWPPGATISLCCAVGYFIALAIKKRVLMRTFS